MNVITLISLLIINSGKQDTLFDYKDSTLCVGYSDYYGIKQGEWKKYSLTNGSQLSIINYKDNILHGSFTAVYNNGTVKEMGNYEKGEKYGTWLYFYPSAHIQKLENYNSKGELTGLRQQYFENGRIEYDQIWYDSTLNYFNMVRNHKGSILEDILIFDSLIYSGNTFDSSGRQIIKAEKYINEYSKIIIKLTYNDGIQKHYGYLKYHQEILGDEQYLIFQKEN